jgi:hypothetical protein
MLKRIAIFLFVISAALYAGCMNEPNLESYPAVSFSNEVRQIIVANCTQPGCHGSGQFGLSTYEEIRANVNPGNGRKSKLYRSITGRNYEFMPPSPSAPLTDDQIRTIFVWIEQGALNN